MQLELLYQSISVTGLLAFFEINFILGIFCPLKIWLSSRNFFGLGEICCYAILLLFPGQISAGAKELGWIVAGYKMLNVTKVQKPT